MEPGELVERLSQLRHLRREADELRRQEANLRLLARQVGGAGEDWQARAARAGEALRSRRAECLKTIMEIEVFLDGIPDSRLRRIFAKRYIDGCSWRMVAEQIGDWDEQAPRRAHNRYLRDWCRAGGDPEVIECCWPETEGGIRE